MLPALLHPKYVFGYRSQVTDNLSFANEHTLVYLAGAVGVTYNLEQNTQRFIANVGHLREVHILHTSPNHQYLAIGERIDAKLHIGVAIYDLVSLKKCNVLVASKLQQQLQQQKQTIVDGVPSQLKFVSLSFSHDCKYIVGQTNESEWTLIYWELESNKIITTLSLSSHRGIGPIHQVSVSFSVMIEPT